MRHYQEFCISGATFSERIGEPSEFDAAMGKLAFGFSDLDQTARRIILLLTGGDPQIGHILVAELSFRQKIDVLGSLGRLLWARLSETPDSPVDPNFDERFKELLNICRQCEELRNTYLHSDYAGGERAKLSAKARHGLRVQRETANASVLLDVADFMGYVANELECVAGDLDIADLISGGPSSLSLFKKGSLVAEFKFGETT